MNNNRTAPFSSSVKAVFALSEALNYGYTQAICRHTILDLPTKNDRLNGT
jgi:hypothetical protein